MGNSPGLPPFDASIHKRMSSYVLIKSLHLGTVFITSALFLLRVVWMLKASPLLQHRLIKVIPHVNDSLLLISGITLAVMTHQYPFVNGWLTAKLFALLAYIVFGSLALKRGRTLHHRRVAALLAIATLAYILAVALNRNPLPYL